jgi:hypothetical protein
MESPASRKFPTWEEHFWSLVKKTDTCWFWMGSRATNGYGNFYDKRMPGRHGLAHRVAFTVAFGPIPKGLFICHRCDTPPCLNPEHLFPGTHTDNMRDAARKQRLRIPRRSKLMPQQVSEIRALFAEGGLTQRSLARQFSIDAGQVWRIVHNKNWQDSNDANLGAA